MLGSLLLSSALEDSLLIYSRFCSPIDFAITRAAWGLFKVPILWNLRNSSQSNCGPLSLTTWSGHPYLAKWLLSFKIAVLSRVLLSLSIFQVIAEIIDGDEELLIVKREEIGSMQYAFLFPFRNELPGRTFEAS